MPSYDKEKLLRMMQARRVEFLATRDLNDRLRNAREEVRRVRTHIEQSAQYAGARDFIEGLLNLPLAQAATLPRQQVEGYPEVRIGQINGEQEARIASGVSYAMWTDFIQAREREGRMQQEQERVQEQMNERFACVPNLQSAVREWGFTDPEREM